MHTLLTADYTSNNINKSSIYNNQNQQSISIEHFIVISNGAGADRCRVYLTGVMSGSVYDRGLHRYIPREEATDTTHVCSTNQLKQQLRSF